MTGDHHDQTAGRATPLVTATDEILGTHREVGVEGAVGQPGVGHERGDPGAVDAVALEPAASRLDDPLPGRLLVLCPVPRHTLLRPPQGPLAVRRCSPTMIVRT
jgi:hypothetical protein